MSIMIPIICDLQPFALMAMSFLPQGALMSVVPHIFPLAVFG